MDKPVKKIKRKSLNLSNNFEKKAKIVLLVLVLLAVASGFLAFGFMSRDNDPTIYGMAYKTVYDINGDGLEDRVYSGVNIALPAEFPEDYIYLVSDAEVSSFVSYSTGTMAIEYNTEESLQKVIKEYETYFDAILGSGEDNDGNLYITGEKNIYTAAVVVMPASPQNKVVITFERED